jgi:hypothetical protein
MKKFNEIKENRQTIEHSRETMCEQTKKLNKGRENIKKNQTKILS